MSSADEIRAAFKKSTLTTKPLELPEMGITVHVRKLSAHYSRRCQELTQIKNVDGAQFLTMDAVTIGILKFAHGVVTEGGEEVFSEEDAAEIAQNHAELFERVVDEVDEISELTPEVVAQEEARFPEREGSQGEGAEDEPSAGNGRPDDGLPVGAGDGNDGGGVGAANVSA